MFNPVPLCTQSHTHISGTPCKWVVDMKGQLTEAEWRVDALRWELCVLAVRMADSMCCPYTCVRVCVCVFIVMIIVLYNLYTGEPFVCLYIRSCIRIHGSL